MARIAGVFVLFCICAQSVDANGFLSTSLDNLFLLDSGALLSKLEGASGADFRAAAERRAPAVETALSTTFASLPKNRHNRVDGTVVRFILHRYFVSRHGWSVKGLDPKGEAWDAALPSQILSGTSAHGAHQIFEEHRHAEIGFDLHEIAIIAATLEYVVHKESASLLEKIYVAEGLSLSVPVSDYTVGKVVEAHSIMAIFSTVVKLPTTVTKSSLDLVRSRIGNLYANWPVMQEWLVNMRRDAPNVPADGGSVYTFQDALNLIEYIADHQGNWQNLECMELKAGLLQLPHSAEGRVPMSEFYRAGLNGSAHFLDSLQYLRMLGALDETPNDIGEPYLIIPNYISAPSNCVAGSDYYSVCCMDECNPLIETIESKIMAPNATVEVIVAIIEGLASTTVSAPRKLSSILMQRLRSIAAHHGGVVPLHGRLFMQWMHNAYPNECKYPHLSGTTQHTSLSDWMHTQGNTVLQSQQDMKKFVEDADKRAKRKPDVPMSPWSAEEELWVSQRNAPLLIRGIKGLFSWLWRRGTVLALAGVTTVGAYKMFSSNSNGPKSSLWGPPEKLHII